MVSAGLPTIPYTVPCLEPQPPWGFSAFPLRPSSILHWFWGSCSETYPALGDDATGAQGPKSLCLTRETVSLDLWFFCSPMELVPGLHIYLLGSLSYGFLNSIVSTAVTWLGFLLCSLALA